jgi:hypothetical protein
MSFFETLKSFADQAESRRPECSQAIQQVFEKWLKRYNDGLILPSTPSAEIAEQFFEDVNASCPRIKPFSRRSHKRGSK